jgi:16S rRNA (cytosine967-C5)-methyltransferase
MVNHTTGANPRRVALKVLNRVTTEDAYANIALDAAFGEEVWLSELDRGLVTAIVYGTIGHQALLDWYLAPFVTKAKPWVRNLLRLTIFQIMKMDRIPASAAVDEAVKLAKREGGNSVGNFVNAVLRNFMRSERKEELPNDWEALYSMPKQILDLLVAQFGGKRTGEILASLEVPAKASVRVLRNREQVLSELAGFVPSEIAPSALVASSGNVMRTVSFACGDITVQDETSQLVVPILMANCTGEEEVLDCCAAPGGKTTHIAEFLTSGHVTACDLYDHKLRLITQNAERLHLADKIITQKADATRDKFSQQFDRILVDAPCSGLGLMRRKPDIKYRKDASDFENLQNLQLQILNNVAPQLKSGGTLVYSTCTLADEENFQVVEKFLGSHSEFEQVLIEVDYVQKCCVFITPEVYMTDGFFIAKLRKT